MSMTAPFWMLDLIRRYSGDAPASSLPRDPREGVTQPTVGDIGAAGADIAGAFGGALSGLARWHGIPIGTPEPVTAPSTIPSVVSARTSSPGRAYPLLSPTDITRGTEDAADVLSDEEFTSAQPAGYSRTGPTRAIRMPDGRMLFTNRPEYGGEEFTPEEGGRIVRASQRATPLNPDSETMRALTRASLGDVSRRATVGEAGAPLPRGRLVPGTTPVLSGGAVSMIEGTPEQQIGTLERPGAKLRDVMGMLTLSGLQQELEKATMPAAARAMLENKDVQSASFLLNRLMPDMRRVQEKAQTKARLISTPGDPAFIADEKLRKDELRKIEMDASVEFSQLQQILSVLMGVRPAPI